MNSGFLKIIQEYIPKDGRTCEEALQITSKLVDLYPCPLETVDEGLIRVMQMNCRIKGTALPNIRAFEIVTSDKNRRNLFLKKPAHLLIEDHYRQIECDNDGVNALFLLILGFDNTELHLTEEQLSNANNELYKSLLFYLNNHKRT